MQFYVLTSIWQASDLKCRSLRLPCSGLILRCVARRSIHLFIACILINHTHTPYFIFFNMVKSKHVFPIKPLRKENAGPYSELFIYIRRLWSREVKMVSLSWQMVHLTNPHRTLRTQRKVVRAGSVVHFWAAREVVCEVPHWPSSLDAFQSSELEQIPFVIPCLLLQKGLSPLLILPSCNISKEAQKVFSVTSIFFVVVSMQGHVKAKQNKKQTLLIWAV